MVRSKNALFAAFILTCTLASCSLFSGRPRGVLSEGEMTRLLTQMHLTEANLRVQNDSLHTPGDTMLIRQRFAQVFRDADVTQEEFNKSLEYYIRHFDQLDEIYNSVISNLTEQEARLQQSKKPHKADTSKLPDSIKTWFKIQVKPADSLKKR